MRSKPHLSKYLNNEITLCDYLDNLLHGETKPEHTDDTPQDPTIKQCLKEMVEREKKKQKEG